MLPGFPNLTTLNLASNKIAGESQKHLSKLTLIYLSSNTYFIKKCVRWDISNSETTVRGTVHIIFRILDFFLLDSEQHKFSFRK